MAARKQIIPINRLRDESNKGIHVKRFCQGTEWHYLTELPVHRDDSYLFILLEHGFGSMDVDFKEIHLAASELCIVSPGQIHYNIKGTDVAGWLLRIDGACISDYCAKILEDVLLGSNIFAIPENMEADCISIVDILSRCLSDMSDIPFKNRISDSLVDTFLNYVVSICVSDNPDSLSCKSRQKQICGDFRKLLINNIVRSKSPSFYAECLCISESYLNEVVKRETGFNVSYWIRERVILEAKRLLSFTDLTVQQVAYKLGYDDHIYFTKLFRQHAGVTPSSFRRNYHK